MLRHNVHVLWANQKSESFEYHWLRALAMLDISSFLSIFVGQKSSVDTLIDVLDNSKVM